MPWPIQGDDGIIPFIARLYNVPAEKLPDLRREEAKRRSAHIMSLAAAAGVIMITLAVLLVWALRSQADAIRSADRTPRSAAQRERDAANQARRAAEQEAVARQVAQQQRDEAERQATLGPVTRTRCGGNESENKQSSKRTSVRYASCRGVDEDSGGPSAARS